MNPPEQSDLSRVDRETHERALAAAYREHIGRLLTEPMTITQLAVYFDVGRNKMSRIIKAMPGVEVCGGQYRVPLAKMPPAYHVQKGLLSRG